MRRSGIGKAVDTPKGREAELARRGVWRSIVAVFNAIRAHLAERAR
jgi:hypothetical protein